MRLLVMAILILAVQISAFAQHATHEPTMAELLLQLRTYHSQLEVQLDTKEVTRAAQKARELANLADQVVARSDELNLKVKSDTVRIARSISEEAKWIGLSTFGKSDEVREHRRKLTQVMQELSRLQPAPTAHRTHATYQITSKTPSAKPAGHAASADITEAGNANCPVTGQAVGSMQAGANIVFGGYKVGLCCDGCQSSFKIDGNKYLNLALKK